MRHLERRFVTATPELRARRDDGTIPVTGHAATFNTYSQNLGGFIEMIQPGAFSKTINEADIRFLLNHNPDYVLARNTNGTLRLSEDNIGLLNEADMSPTTYANDLAINLGNGNVNQMSFGFYTMKDDWDITDQGVPLRILKEARLFDTSAVTYPAYEDSEIGLRSLAKRHKLHELDANHRIDLFRSVYQLSREQGISLAEAFAVRFADTQTVSITVSEPVQGAVDVPAEAAPAVDAVEETRDDETVALDVDIDSLASAIASQILERLAPATVEDAAVDEDTPTEEDRDDTSVDDTPTDDTPTETTPNITITINDDADSTPRTVPLSIRRRQLALRRG